MRARLRMPADGARNRAAHSHGVNDDALLPAIDEHEQASSSLPFAIQSISIAPPKSLLRLQDAAGNRAVQRLVTSSTQRHPEGPHELPIKSSEEEYTVPDVRIPPPGTGRQIPVRFRSRLETAFNVDFSGVRVREGKVAPQLDSIAYTRGLDIEFARGHYSPHTGSGRRLLAHELAHVVQQQAGRVPLPRDQDVPDRPWQAGVPLNNDRYLESEAGRQGRRAAWDMPARIRGQRMTVRRPFIPVVQSSPVGRLAAGASQPTE